MHLRLLMSSAVLAAAMCVTGHADTISQTFHTGAIGITFNGDFSADNYAASLGTLNSITGTVMGYSSFSSTEQVDLYINGSTLISQRLYGPGFYTGSGKITDVNVLSGVTQSGSSDLRLSFSTTQPVADLLVTLNYDYTPVTPEPSSLVLLGTGLVGVFGLVRRKLVS